MSNYVKYGNPMRGLLQSGLLDLHDGSMIQDAVLVGEAVETLASGGSIGERGAVSTRIEIVDFILDLVGYTASRPLHKLRILEPSFGEGSFLFAIVERLLAAWRKHGGNMMDSVLTLGAAIRGVELHRAAFVATRKVLIERLGQEGISTSIASELVEQWLIQGDFLLEADKSRFDFVVGNPPYVRQELIPAPLLSVYRKRYRTMYDRADLYVPFIERSLSLLNEKGVLGFICSDRWMKNRYGGPLRGFVSKGYHLKVYVDMVDSEAFHSEVSVYPAITVIERSKAGVTRIAHRPKVEKSALSLLCTEIRSQTLSRNSSAREMAGIVSDCEPWLLESSDQMLLIRRIESQFPSLEQAGNKVGIGVATGADRAFIGDFDSLDVEADRKLPIVATRDIRSGEVVWRGQGVINPFNDDGNLVCLSDYPRLTRYLEGHKDIIAKRHCAQKRPAHWYRTIDRIWPALTGTPKLLIPDIKGEAHVVFEPGNLYPHHNLYYVVSEDWDLRALQAVLLSSLTKLFVATYSTKMRGGYLRFQAQYLRRVRVPFWSEVSESLRLELIHAAHIRDIDACNRAVFKLYKLNRAEQSAIGGNGE